MKRAALIILIIMTLCSQAWASEGAMTIKCLSTTSTENSGLTDYLLPIFEADTGIKVMLIARGTGAALEAGKRGDADVVLVHSKPDELKLVEEGFFTDRYDIMYNDFVLLGPKDDPAGISNECTSVDHAFKKIAELNRRGPHTEVEAPFVSRGDNSGTHKKELSIWQAAGIDLAMDKDGGWYMEVGQGMAKAMRVADEKGAYILADRGTWLAIKDQLSNTRIVFEGDPALVNQYGVMAVNPKLHPHVKYVESMVFINWLRSDKGQRAIGDFKANGEQMFIPNAGDSTDTSGDSTGKKVKIKAKGG